MGILLCQISTHLIEKEYPDPVYSGGNEYYDKFWEVRKKDGYLKPYHFWELPPWVALTKGNIPDAEFVIVENINEFVKSINNQNHSYICFSVLDCNKEIIKKIIDKYEGNATFAVGGYINLRHYFRLYDNVYVFDSIKQFSSHIMGRYLTQYDYSHFKNWECIPRLTLSDGCYNRCKFCIVPKFMTECDSEDISNQIKSFKGLKFELVYMGDKTFGQANNHVLLPQIYKKIKTYNKDFRGFIIQTTSRQFFKLSDGFIKDSHIKIIELGIETVNDPILLRYRKPTNVSDANIAAKRAEHLSCKLAPNIIIGMPEETGDTYQNTLDYLEKYKGVISHLGICTLAIYEKSELFKEFGKGELKVSELCIEKSFHKNKQVHRWFANKLYSLGIKLLR